MKSSSRLKKNIFFLTLCILASGIVPGIFYNIFHKSYYNVWSPRLFRAPEFDRALLYYPEKFMTLAYINRYLAPSDVILSFRQTESLFYGHNRIYRHLDPIFFKLYKLSDKMEAYRFLRNLGIDYLYLPPYQLPTYYNTSVQEIVADPALSEVEYENGGLRLVKLFKTPRSVTTATLIDFDAAAGKNVTDPHVMTTLYKKGVAQMLDNVTTLREKPLLQGQDFDRRFGFMGNFTSFVTYTGKGNFLSPDSSYGTLKQDANYVYSFTLRGKGNFQVYVLAYHPARHLIPGAAPLEKIKIWDSALFENARVVRGQFKAPVFRDGETPLPFRILFILQSSGFIDISGMKLVEVEKPTTSPSSKSHAFPQLYAGVEDGYAKMTAGMGEDSLAKLDFTRMKSPGASTGFGSDALPPVFYPLQFDHLDFSKKRVLVSFEAKGSGAASFYVDLYDRFSDSQRQLVSNLNLGAEFKEYSFPLYIPERFDSYRLCFYRLSPSFYEELMNVINLFPLDPGVDISRFHWFDSAKDMTIKGLRVDYDVPDFPAPNDVTER